MSNWQLEQLSALSAGLSVDTEVLDLSGDELPPSPIQAVFEKAEFIHVGGDAELYEALGRDSTPLAKSDRIVPAGFVQQQPFGSACGKTEEWTSPSGELWKRTYNASGELIDAHVVNGDGDPLSKRAGENLSKEGNTIDLAKRASPHMIRFEHTTIDGEDWILGWNDAGENVRAYPACDLET